MSLSAPYGTDAWLHEARDMLSLWPCPFCEMVGLNVEWIYEVTADENDCLHGVSQEALITCPNCGRHMRGRLPQ